MAPIPNPEKPKPSQETTTGGVLSREEFERQLSEENLSEYLADYLRIHYHSLSRTGLGQDGVAEELVQETLTKGFKNLDKFKGESSLKTWLVRILINCVSNYYRKKAIDPLAEDKQLYDWYQNYPDHENPMDTMHHNDLNPEEVLIQKDQEKLKAEQKKKLYTAINKLSKMQRTTMILRLKGLEVKEIAKELNMTEATAKNALFRARRELEKLLKRKIPLGFHF